MRITTPEVVWHGGEAGKNDPILSVDVHPCGVLATGGADGEVRFWRLRLEENEESKFQEYLYAFENHERSVNAVRFSPDGRTLATASDGGLIILFTLPEGRPAHYWRRDVAARKVQAMLVRTAQADIYDLAWSPSSLEFASVSVDNRVCFWQIQGAKAYPAATFTSHQNYVQGVAWDPRDRYIVSQSNDRSCRVYKKREDEAAGKKKSSKKKRPAGPPFTEVSLMRLASRPEDVAKAKEEETCCIVQAKVSSPGGGARRRVEQDDDSDDDEGPTASSSSAAANAQDGGGAASAAPAAPAPKEKRAPRPHLFADETVPSFFRRPAWSPDGCLLLTPAGVHKRGDSGAHGKTEYATHVYSRDSFATPVLELPHPGAKASVAVRFCPQLFALKPTTTGGSAAAGASPSKEEGKAEPGVVAITPPQPLTNLPYRMVFAVVTVSGVLVYDTQHHYPLAFVKNSHYAPLTDVAWLSDGRALVATSMDGYVTVLSFPDHELGVPLELEKVPPSARAMYKAYYDGVQKGAEGEEDERAEEEERRARAERKAAKEAAKKEARRKKKLEEKLLAAQQAKQEGSEGEGMEEGLEGDGDDESTAASSTSGSGSGGSPASRASRVKTRGGGGKRGGGVADDLVSLLDEESSDEEEDGSKKPAQRQQARAKKGDSDGESLKSEAMSEDEGDEEESEAGEGAPKWERVEDEEDEAASAASAAGSKKEKKKRASSEMAPEPEEAEAEPAAAKQEQQPQQQAPAQPAAAGAGSKKKAAKRIKPTLVSVEPAAGAAGPSPQSSPASVSSASSSSGAENKPAAANTTNTTSTAAAAAEGAAKPAAGAAKAKKRVTPILVSSKPN